MSISPAHPDGAAAHVRQHLSPLAAPEKRLLIWIARRLPRWTTSDQLSLLGLLSMLGAALGFAAIRLSPWAAVAVVLCLALNWFGDSLDGTLARVRGQQRPRYGYYVDHVIDLAGTALLMTGLAVSGAMTPAVAISVLAAYLLVCGEAYLATHASGVFRMSFAGFGPTELRLLLAAGAVKIAQTPWVEIGALGSARLFDIGGLVAVAGLVTAFLIGALRNTRALYVEEPLPAVEAARSAA